MIPVGEHLDRILATVRALPPTTQALSDARGALLAADLFSTVSLPGFDNSAMDGYALRACDIAPARPNRPVRLPVADDVPAGDTRRLILEPTTAVRIMTGAPVPEGADAVVPVEQTNADPALVEVREPVAAGAYIRRAGEDVQPGRLLLAAGTRMGPRQLALAAAAGVGWVEVIPAPRVLVMSTGDELVDPGTFLTFGKVVDSNGVMLAAAIEALGGRAYRVSGVSDTEQDVLDALEEHLGDVDAVITTGGVSMGVYDAVKAALSKLGTVEFTQVAMQPGKPQGFGVVGTPPVPVFTLPGNPVSALVSFEVFVAPALRMMAGRPAHETPPVRAVAAHDWTSPAGKTQYARVCFAPDGAAGSTARPRVALVGGSQGSHILGGLAEADALAVVPPDIVRVRAGDELDCLLLPGGVRP